MFLYTFLRQKFVFRLIDGLPDILATFSQMKIAVRGKLVIFLVARSPPHVTCQFLILHNAQLGRIL